MSIKLGLIGQQIFGSLSPLLHTYSAELLGFSVSYELWETEKLTIQFLRDLALNEVIGINITSPFKKVAGSLLGLHGVNTLYRGKNHSWQGLSTDGMGFWEAAFRWIGGSPCPWSRLILLGSGGAAKAIAMTKPGGMDGLYCSRQESPSWPPGWAWASWDEKNLKKLLWEAPPQSTLLVQASSAEKSSLQCLEKALENWPGYFMSLNYGKRDPLEKPIIRAGGQATDGLGMLVAQGLFAQNFWWGRSAPFEKVYDRLRAQQNRSNLPGDD